MQAHPELSPLGWHLVHCVYVECYWLREAAAGDDRVTRALAGDAWPAFAGKAARGGRLDDLAALLAWASALQAENLALLERDAGIGKRDADRFPLPFLIAHHVQHVETMDTARVHRVLAGPAPPGGTPPAHGRSGRVPERRSVPSGRYRIGAGDGGFAFDNERPARWVELDGFSIAERPVGNAAFLAFVEAGGYRCRGSWSPDGWAWLAAHRVAAPSWWRRAADGSWWEAGTEGWEPLDPETPVTGIGWHEARAFARWAGARLPREAEWETGARLGLLDGAGRVWEWCDEVFHPYPGFRAFPYDEYSLPWFDGRHYVLRGGSRLSGAEVRTASFRNFYGAGTRHLPAGLRLAW